MKKYWFLLIFTAGALMAPAAQACDVCSTYVALAGRDVAGSTTLNIYQLYSDYDAPARGGHAFKSSSTQLSVSHWLTDRWALQLGVPYLYRDMDGDKEKGLGDATLIALYRLVNQQQEANVIRLDVYAGVKMPTGDSDRLKDERAGSSGHGHGSMHRHAAPHAAASAHAKAVMHSPASSPHGGHHVALGSGSWDGIVGVKGLVKKDRWMALAESQYNYRTEGDYGWKHGDEFTWRIGPHYFVALDETKSLSFGVELSGEWRDANELDGEQGNRTSKKGNYAGGVVRYTRDALQLLAGLELPISDKDKGVRGAADYRARLSAGWSF